MFTILLEPGKIDRIHCEKQAVDDYECENLANEMIKGLDILNMLGFD